MLGNLDVMGPHQMSDEPRTSTRSQGFSSQILEQGNLWEPRQLAP